ncbi:MAG: hypothetical protein CMJ89_06120 [Planctomycetes bacterium]|nr:hypothetical protein [Planctomycetota bacterium]
MTRYRKVGVVLWFEFWGTVRRKAYLITTFGMPVFLLMYLGFFGYISTVGERLQEDRPRIFGVVDQAGVTKLGSDMVVSNPDLPPDVALLLQASGPSPALDGILGVAGKTVFRPMEEREGAIQAIADGDIQGLFVLPRDYVATGSVEVLVPDEVDWKVGDTQRAFGRLLSEHILQDRIEPELAERVRAPFAKPTEWTVTREGELRPRNNVAQGIKLIVPIVFSMLLFLSIMMTSGYLLQGTAAEKENKVVEVLLSSVNPEELLLGKLFGLGFAGMIQIGVWFAMVVLAGLVAAGTLEAYGVEVPWLSITLSLAFFPAAYLLVGSLILGTGALGGSLKESNQLSAIWTLPSAAPLMLLGILMSTPHGTLAQVLTWIPLTTSATLIFRTAIDASQVAWWEIVGPFLLLLASIRFSLAVGARLYRIGILRSGSRPKLREILRQARLST